MIKINKSIILDNCKINYSLVKSSRAKHIKISIDFEGMRVVIPKGVNIDFLEQFLFLKEKWIIEHYLKYKEELNNQLYFRGNEISYKLLKNEKANSIEFHGNILIINSIKEFNPEEVYLIIKNWYIKMATYYFNERVTVNSRLIGVNFNRISIKEQKTRWGSCSSKGNLNFNWKLIMAPSFVLEYIVIHELCHLIYMNHSKDFWKEVERFMPNYELSEEWLKLNSRKLNLNILRNFE